MSALDTATDDQITRAFDAQERDERVHVVLLAWRYGILCPSMLGEALDAIYRGAA